MEFYKPIEPSVEELQWEINKLRKRIQELEQPQMYVNTAYYQQNFQVGEFLYRHYGFGVCVPQGGDSKQAMDEAKRLVEEYHKEDTKKDNSSITEYPAPLPYENRRVTITDLPVIETQSRKGLLEYYIDEIYKIKTLNKLNEFQAIAKSYPVIQEAYNFQFEKLTHQ